MEFFEEENHRGCLRSVYDLLRKEAEACVGRGDNAG